ncbi:hypothetical protein AAVH_17045, partial [Aphelenchoides avenae]
CAATKKNTQARIFLEESSGMTVLPYLTKTAVDCTCNNCANLWQQFWNAAVSPTSESSI